MPDGAFRHCRYKLWKGGGLVSATFRGNVTFSRAAVTSLLDRARIFAVDTESLKVGNTLKTLLIPVRYHDHAEMIRTGAGTGMLHALFESLFQQPGFAVPEGQPSATKQRAKTLRGRRKLRDGRRQSLDPVLSVWFNLPYDFGRLCADLKHVLRSVAAGADAYRVAISPRFELEVVKMHFGSSSAFEWLVRDKQAKTIVRLLGMDLTGYWKTSLAGAAKAAGVKEKIDIESKIEHVYEKARESFTDAEWAMFEDYGLGDVESTLDLYHATALLLTTIDARVVKNTGVIPSSAPGAAAKIVFAKAFDCHPDITQWRRYPAWADQLGCQSYYGGRVFCVKPGVYSRVSTLDIKSAYPFQTALLPDPVTVRMRAVTPCATFDVARWKGQYGVLVVSGEGLDARYPAFRVHDPRFAGRLRYVAGPFSKLSVTIPELVVGVLRGALRIDQIHWGVVMEGSAEHSFLRKGMAEFFSIKENKQNDKALRDMAKLLANSTYGKLIEVQCMEYLVGDKIPVPPFWEKARVADGIATVFANGCAGEDTYFGDTEEEIARAVATFEDSMLRFDGTDTDRGVHAIAAYVEALTLAGVRLRTGTTMSVAAFVRAFRRYRCGQFFMPLYASQITGGTSAMLGCMAACLGALQGDTDSVHVQLPPNVRRIVDMPGVKRYFDIMQAAGYPSPYQDANDTWVNGIPVPGLESLGSWTEESNEPSVESVLVRPKVYSHRFGPNAKDNNGKALTFKQAKHGFAKYHSPAIEAILRDGTVPRDERTKNAAFRRQSEMHEAMKIIQSGVPVEYRTRSSPRRLREAVRHGGEVGEFVSRKVKLACVVDPNTEVDETGFVRWKPLEAEVAETLLDHAAE